MSIPRTAARALASLVVVVAGGLAGCTSSGSPAAPSGGASASGPSASGATAPGTGPASPSEAAASYPAGSAAIVPQAPALDWKACGGQLTGMKCTTLQVPLNYADPGGRKITIALSMAPATAPAAQQQGVMLVNPGGPGGSGRSFASWVASTVSSKVRADYDIVGFDPRGVADSVPALSCDPNFFKGARPDYIPASATAEQTLINRAKSYAAGCEKRYGWFLPYETTVNTARDMDQIRQSLGVKQVSYYGVSYGTYLGEVYGTLFPGSVRRMVLDSSVDPTGAWYADNIAQDYAFQDRIDAFFAWVAKYESHYHLGTTAAEVQASYDKIRGLLRQHPLNGQVGEDELDDTVVQAGYATAYWPSFAQALSDYLNGGDGANLLTQYQEVGLTPENEFAVYNAVECGDVNWPRNWSRWQADTEKVYKSAAFYAWDNAWFNAACAFWAVKGPDNPFQVNGSKLPPVLMLQGTLDPATPYAGAQNAHKLLPSARMVVVEGDGNHGQSLQTPADSCVLGYLNRYLADGSVPGKPGLVNATCAAVADPTPLSPYSTGGL